MRLGKALLVFRKDWREVRRNWEVLTPIAVVPLLFTVVIPLIAIHAPGQVNTGTSPDVLVESIVRGMPPDAVERLMTLTGEQQLTYVLLVYMFAPFFMLIPVMASSVIASDSFAGEKERKTIEALLATPLTDGELLLGKMLTSFVPSISTGFILILLLFSTFMFYLHSSMTISQPSFLSRISETTFGFAWPFVFCIT